MQLESVRPSVVRLTLHVFELSALMAAARWAMEGAPGQLTPDARDHLRQIMERYDAATRAMTAPGAAEAAARGARSGGEGDSTNGDASR